jgi:hypothetical protein
VIVGFHAPLPPARTGVADYATQLLAAMRRFGRVEVAPRNAGVHLYHLGNNALHASIHRRCLDEPGVVVLHDAVLHHFYLGSLSREAYVEEFVFNYGEWSRSLAASLWDGRARSAGDPRYFQFGMLRRVAETAKAVVVHNRSAAERVRRHASEATVVEIPHLFHAPADPPAAAVLHFRSKLGIAPSQPLCGVFGYLRESKRILPVLRVCRRLEIPLLLAGEADRDLQRALTVFDGNSGVHRLPFLPQAEWWVAAHATDLCVNLRYPPAGESSGVAIRMMGIRKPVLLTDSDEVASFPASACIRILPGPGEEEHLEYALSWLIRSFGDRHEIGVRAADHIRRHHAPDAVAQQYWQLLRSVK